MEANVKQKVDLNFSHNKMELIPDTDCEIVHEDGKWYVIRKKEKYPKTYVECCKVLGCKPIFGFSGLDDDEENLYGRFIALVRCRDAYWKIAGEEMGLGEPWEPDWYTKLENKHYISTECGKVIMNFNCYKNNILAFPTAEMRDAFYENFKELIEQCKELL